MILSNSTMGMINPVAERLNFSVGGILPESYSNESRMAAMKLKYFIGQYVT